MKTYLNGKLVEKEDAKISVFDHGLLYGDGVFEGIRAYNRLVFKLEEHVDRLFESAHSIMLEIPLDRKEMAQAVVQTLKANNLADAYIRLVVTRGEGTLGLDPRKCSHPTVIVITDRIELYPEEFYRKGLEIITVPTPRNFPEALNPQIKSLNYLNNILAKIEATNSGAQEALMLSSSGYVAECTADNIFMIKGKRLLTPPVHVGVLRGITRQAVMNIGREQKLTVEETVLTRHDLFNAAEIFITGTGAEIVPVVKLDGRVIGDGKPGKITGTLIKEFRKLTATDGIKY